MKPLDVLSVPPQSGSMIGGERRLVVPHRAGFWLTAVAFTVMMAFNTVPTPLYVLYQQRDGFATFVVTVIFASYALGVIGSLYLAGHLSDRFGRRRLILAAAGIESVAAVFFLLWSAPVGLVVARLLAGAGIGILAATATTHLSELRSVSHPDGGARFASTIGSAANLGGLGLGAVIGGAFAEWSSRPLIAPYLAFLAAIVTLAFAYAFVPETVERRADPFRYRPQQIAVPREDRRTYRAAGMGAFAAFAVTGLYGSVAPSFLAEVAGQTDRMIAGLVAASVFGTAAIAQVAFARLRLRRQLVVGVVGMLTGMLLLGVGDVSASQVWFVAAGVVAGVGVGLLFRGALTAAAALSNQDNRSEVLAGIFLLAFAGLGLPPVLVGVALLILPVTPVLLAFAALIAVLGLWAGAVLIQRTAWQ
ncbi:MFS transporter [Nocardia testacea]|uniref:MFS transporter n=1 Tax=Nocardia testacea TaxID=248551 RepID=UPI0033EEF244